MAKFYQIIDHTADIGVRVNGKTIEELFVNAARAVIDITLGPNVEEGRGPLTNAVVSIEAPEREELLVKWMQEVLYLFEVKRQIANGFKIKSLTGKRLIAEVKVVHFDTRVHEVRREIKAVTYHNLKVKELTDGQWEAEIIFDI